jgi:hypothetical protein
MRLDTLIRSFLIGILVSLIAVIIEAAYYGLHPAKTSAISSVGYYSVSSPFFNHYSDLTSSVNLTILAIIFICTFVIALIKISKQEHKRYG